MKLIRVKEVAARTGKSRPRIYADIAAGKFPPPVRIGDRAVAWVDEEVDAWMASRVAARDTALS